MILKKIGIEAKLFKFVEKLVFSKNVSEREDLSRGIAKVFWF